jgi:hypothetical protein
MIVPKVMVAVVILVRAVIIVGVKEMVDVDRGVVIIP